MRLCCNAGGSQKDVGNSGFTLGYNATSQLRYNVAEMWRSSSATATLLLRCSCDTARIQCGVAAALLLRYSCVAVALLQRCSSVAVA